MTHQIISAGFGGQGVLLLGQLVAYAGMAEGKNISWLPSYGPEMRGGTANCAVCIDDKENVIAVDKTTARAFFMNFCFMISSSTLFLQRTSCCNVSLYGWAVTAAASVR